MPKKTKREPTLALAVVLVTIMSACVWCTFSLLTQYRDCGLGAINGVALLAELTFGAIVWLPGIAIGLPLVATLGRSSRWWVLV
jgi:hypothetical protein